MNTSHASLEAQSDRIEQALAQHDITGRVTGGLVTPRVVQFRIACPHLKKVQSMASDLALALDVPAVQVARHGDGIILQVRRIDSERINLLTVLRRLAENKSMTPFTAFLGMCDDGAPLLIRLPANEVGHVIISGGCKSELLRTMVISLALFNKPRDMRLVLVGNVFADLARLPHVQAYAADNTQVAQVMADLVRLVGRSELAPRVVILMDGLGELKGDGDLAQLLREGHAAGIHIVVAHGGELSSAGFSTVISAADAPGDSCAYAEGDAAVFGLTQISPAEVGQVVAQFSSAPRRWDVVNGWPWMWRIA